MNFMTSLNNVLHRISCGRKRRRAMRELNALDEWRLRDIGMWRGAIPETVDQILHRQGCARRGR